jgi:mono/diheme cytochrome c family protein
MADPKLERGRVAFMQHCHQCHPGGEGGLGPGLNDKPLPGFLIKMQTRAGLGAMPAFTTQALPPDKLGDIVAYLKVVRKRH